MLAKFIGGPVNQPAKRSDKNKESIYSIHQHGSVGRCKHFGKMLKQETGKLRKVAA